MITQTSQKYSIDHYFLPYIALTNNPGVAIISKDIPKKLLFEPEKICLPVYSCVNE